MHQAQRLRSIAISPTITAINDLTQDIASGSKLRQE